MPSVLETRFMEQVPRLLRDLADEVAELCKSVALLNQQLNELQEELKTANELSAFGGE